MVMKSHDPLTGTLGETLAETLTETLTETPTKTGRPVVHSRDRMDRRGSHWRTQDRNSHDRLAIQRPGSQELRKRVSPGSAISDIKESDFLPPRREPWDS